MDDGKEIGLAVGDILGGTVGLAGGVVGPSFAVIVGAMEVDGDTEGKAKTVG